MASNTDVLIVANKLSRGLVEDTHLRSDIEYILDVLQYNEAQAAQIFIEHSTTNKVFRLQMLVENLKSYVKQNNKKRTPPIVLEMCGLMVQLSNVLETTLSEYRSRMVTPNKTEKIVVSLDTMKQFKTKKRYK